jgi:hypothetical protein
MWTSASPAPSRLLVCLAALACIAAGAPALTGMWGAGDALLAIDGQGGRLQVGCALVRFAPVTPDKNGQFRTAAQVEQINLAPPVADGPDDDAQPEPQQQNAVLTGTMGKGTMELTLTIDRQAPRTLQLVAGQRITPPRCL